MQVFSCCLTGDSSEDEDDEDLALVRSIDQNLHLNKGLPRLAAVRPTGRLLAGPDLRVAGARSLHRELLPPEGSLSAPEAVRQHYACCRSSTPDGDASASKQEEVKRLPGGKIKKKVGFGASSYVVAVISKEILETNTATGYRCPKL